MLKELLIIGLLGSVSSIDTHQTTHYQNNTQYLDFSCNICRENNLTETHVTYLQNSKYKYDFMDLFLEDYQTDVIDSFTQEVYSFYSSDDKELEYFNPKELRHKFYDLSNSLVKKVKHSRSVNRDSLFNKSKPVSFKITHEGVLTFD